MRPKPWARGLCKRVAGAGAAMALGGGLAWGQSRADLQALRALCSPGCSDGADALKRGAELRDRGKTWDTTGWVLVGAGATAIAGGVAWALWRGEAASKVSVLPTASGGVVIWAGQFD